MRDKDTSEIDPRGLDELCEALGYAFRDRSLLIQALTHSSYRYETTGNIHGSNEVLEFLGDAVVNLVTAAILIALFPEKTEGSLSKMRAELVNERSLADVAKQFRLEERLLVGRSARVQKEGIPRSLLADAVEALVGAVFQDGGFEAASRIVSGFIRPLIDLDALEKGTDYKTRLQEFTQKTYKTLPEYRLVDTFGPEHQKTFVSSVYVQGKKLGTGEGRSIKASEQKAAKVAFEALSEAE